jgi:hypothetical protein
MPLQEDELMIKPELKVEIPEQLKGLLVDDWENVTKTQKVLLTTSALLSYYYILIHN